MIAETTDRRILGALAVINPLTGLPIAARVAIHAQALQALSAGGAPVGSPQPLDPAAVRFVRNNRGEYVIVSAPGFAAYTRAFYDLPAVPKIRLSIRISDPGGIFLAVSSSIELPRDVAPEHANQPDSIFRALPVPLYLSPAARTEMSWAVIRATVRKLVTQGGKDSGADRLPWSLIRVLEASSGRELARALADARGEALVAVPGILITMPADGTAAVLTRELEVKFEAAFDLQLASRSEQDLLSQTDPNQDHVASPDALRPQCKPARLQTAARDAVDSAQLAAGRVMAADVLLKLP